MQYLDVESLALLDHYYVEYSLAGSPAADRISDRVDRHRDQ